MLKEYQKDVVEDLKKFFEELNNKKKDFEQNQQFAVLKSHVNLLYSTTYRNFKDECKTGIGEDYPRICIKIPTGGGKTLLAVEAIRAYQNILRKNKVGLVVWITHREQIYRQTIENLQNKGHPYRQVLDQASGNRTIILGKGQFLRRQDVEENLVVMMLMIQSASRESNKLFSDSGYVDFFPHENRYDLHKSILEQFPNLDCTDANLFGHMQIKSSLGNVIRTQSPLIIVDEFHTMFSDNAKEILDGLNPKLVLGLSATPKREMNIISKVSGRQLEREEMIKLDIHLVPPSINGDWQSMLSAIVTKRQELEADAIRNENNSGIYIRPIALIQAERTGKDQRGIGFVHSEDVREFLINLGVARHQIAVKSSSLDEIKAQKLLSRNSELRFIITKEALKEGWDCSFAYILGVIPSSRSNSSVTQLVGRVLRQPYAKKTKFQSLNESYVYFASGDTQEVLSQIKNGFEIEGLGDLSSSIDITGIGGVSVSQTKKVSIKNWILDKHYHSLFLPVWVKKEAETYRRYSYKADVYSKIDWLQVEMKELFGKLIPTIGVSSNSQVEFIIGLDEQSEKETFVELISTFNPLFLTRRIFNIVGNGFVAHELSIRLFRELSRHFDKETLNRDSGYITRELEKFLIDYRQWSEQNIFHTMISKKEVVLMVTDDVALGFSLPKNDQVTNLVPSNYQYSLYEDVDIQSLNLLERNVVSLIEESSKVLWWARNKVRAPGWFFIQGWREHRIWPDFIVAKKGNTDAVEMLYVFESKGEQLLGNSDTIYKSEVFETLNKQKTPLKLSFTTSSLNFQDKYEFSLIPQGEEEFLIRGKLSDIPQ